MYFIAASIVFALLCLTLAWFLWVNNRKINKLRQEYQSREHELSQEIENRHTLESELTALKEQVSNEVLTDMLTGLPSRKVFEDNLNLTLNQSARYNMIFGVMFLDLDEFKVINEALGHGVGDLLLKEVAARMLTCVRQVDTVSRFAGDEFVLILPQLGKAETVVYVAQRLLDAISQPFNLQGQELYITASIGVSVYPADGSDGKTLLQNADNALHQAKAHGRNTYQFYRKEMYAVSRRELLLSSSLQSESIYQNFSVYYQPRINIETKKVVCMEAQLRWQHPDFGWIAWSEFSRLAENHGKIVAIGEWVIKNACQNLLKWKALGFSPSYVAIQVSLKQIENTHFIHRLSSILQEMNLNPDCIMLEIAESSLVTRSELIEKMLPMFKHLGVQIAIKNFGTGNLSLQHLKHLPIDSLKIDQTLIQDVTANKDSLAIIKMIVALAHSLQIGIVAEGVESLKQKQLLQELGCNMMQGDFFSSPSLADEFTEEIVQRIGESA